MDKKKRLLEIVYDLQELYPHLDRLLIYDFEDPQSITITTQDKIDSVAEEQGLEVEFVSDLFDEVMADEDPFDSQMQLIDWNDDDDDNGGGMLQ